MGSILSPEDIIDTRHVVETETRQNKFWARQKTRQDKYKHGDTKTEARQK